MGFVRNPVLLAAASHPGSMERSYARSPEVARVTDEIPVLVAQVQAVDRHVSGRPVIQLDCRMDDLPFAWSEARLLNRHSSARARLWLVVRRPSRIDMIYSEDVLALRLPSDLRLGDLLAVPSRSLAAVDALRAELS
jgi:hypothetical protein